MLSPYRHKNVFRFGDYTTTDLHLDPAVHAHLVAIAARHQSGNPSDQLPDGLTAREGQVLGLMAQGLSNREIARVLVLSEATIKTHINRIFTKTGSRDRGREQRHYACKAYEEWGPPDGCGEQCTRLPSAFVGWGEHPCESGVTRSVLPSLASRPGRDDPVPDGTRSAHGSLLQAGTQRFSNKSEQPSAC